LLLPDTNDIFSTTFNHGHFSGMEDSEHGIIIHVKADFLEQESDPGAERFVFAYTITIRNAGNVPARLLNRHWIITDGNGKVEEVRGKGVVGKQPYLKPGEQFRYTSGTMIGTPVGSMHGSYDMLADDGTRFDAAIAPFSLAMAANRLH
jgi:ApaG protein